MVDMESALIIETDLAFSKGIGYILEQEGFSILYAYNIQDARKIINSQELALICMNQKIRGGEGIELARELREKGIKTPIVMMSGYPAEKMEDLALQAGINKYYEKGQFDFKNLGNELLKISHMHK